MKIAYIAPGFGGTFYCQNCLQSMTLIQAFNGTPHTLVMVPMYLPFRVDIPVGNRAPLFYNAINVYLKEKLPIMHHLPAWFTRIFDSTFMLRLASAKSGVTDPHGLESMTISVMQGASGNQASELERLITYLRNEIKPDVVHCANVLLIGIAARIRHELNIPVFCTMQDENYWLDAMREPYSSQGWDLITHGARIIDGFISTSAYYAQYMHTRAQIPKEKIHIVPEGIPINIHKKPEVRFDPPVIGYLSRMADFMGLDILVEAFMILKRSKKHNNVQLKITGGISHEDRVFVKKIIRKLTDKNFIQDVHIDPDLYTRDMTSFFESLTLLSVPAHQGEASGIFLLDVMARGIPVVQPERGAYPEIIQATGGGVVYNPNTPQMLAETISHLLDNPDTIHTMSTQGYNAVRALYPIEKMRDNLLRIYHHACS